MSKRHLFTSESVTEGHPDKVCDQISDAVLDAVLADDPDARVACECIATTGFALVMGEISTSTYVDIPTVARGVICDAGYNSPRYGFDGNTCGVLSSIDGQSPDIAAGVTTALEARSGELSDGYNLGAGDQGMVFGFACDETSSLMPAPIHYAHMLARELSQLRKSGEIDYLGPDGKTQVTVEYEDDKPVRIDTVLVSSQHDADVSQEQIHQDIREKLIFRTLPKDLLDEHTRTIVNPSGRFVVGGPQGDSGLTGRKIIVDTYGGRARHGGGSFSGKDPSKVDRSAAYAARFAAKNIVAAGLARQCEIEIAYAIGMAHPVSVWVDTQGTGTISDAEITSILLDAMDFRPAAIIERLELKRPIYRQTAAYGHFGREDLNLPWESTDVLAAELKKNA